MERLVRFRPAIVIRMLGFASYGIRQSGYGAESIGMGPGFHGARSLQ